MDIFYEKKDKYLKFVINEELDHHIVEKLRKKADYEIERHIPKKVIFDFQNVTFMDSAGIGLILGRYRNVSVLGGIVEIINVNDNINKILTMSGITRLIKIKEKECA